MIYNELYLKMKDSIYKKRPSQQSKTLEKGIEKFRSLDNLSAKAYVINEILKLFQCDAMETANLKQIGGSPYAGDMKINKNTITSKSLKLIHQSVTGLFETEEVLV